MDNDHDKNPHSLNSNQNPSWHDVWQIIPECINFLKRPFLQNHYQPIDKLAAFQLALLFAVNFILTVIILIFILTPYAEIMDIPQPQVFSNESLGQMILSAVILAPLIEETMFRGWLRGSKRALLFLAIPVLYLIGLWIIFETSSGSDIMIITVFLWSFLITFDGFFFVKKTFYDATPMPQYIKYFPIIFYISGLAFGLVHILNYDHHNIWALIPMVITQFLGGLVYGYARLRFGLSAAMLMHAVSNGILVMTIYLFPS